MPSQYIPDFHIMSRIRPPNNMQKRKIYGDLTDNKIIHVINEKMNLKNDVVKTDKTFRFDKVFDIDYNNEDVFHEIAQPMIDNFLNGENGTFFVYGQTGSGKTHTTLGTQKEMGFLEYVLQHIVKSSKFDKTTYLVGIQLYNNKCFDVFNNNNKIQQCEDAAGKIHLRNSVRHHLDEINIRDVIQNVKEMRMNGISSENAASSRSHLLIQIWSRKCFLNILDMAGSEKASKSICRNRREMMENAKINESILALKECIRAVKMGKKYVPYRHNNLTKILKDVFFGRGMSYIMATISPEQHNVKESINTLSYISDMYTMKRQLSEPTYLKTIRDLHIKHHDSTMKTPREEEEKDNEYYQEMTPQLGHQKDTAQYFMKILHNCSAKRNDLFDRFMNGVSLKYKDFKNQMKSLLQNEIAQLKEFDNIL